jgi:hypothetical protein
VATSADNLIPSTPLDTFRRIFQWNPRHFWGWAGTGKARVTAKCLGLLREYGWQDQDAAARSGIREALAVAEQHLAQWLGFSPVPTYGEATLPYPTLGDLRFQHSQPAYGSDGRSLALPLPVGEVLALGVPDRSIIGDVPLVGPVPYVGVAPAAPYLIYRDRDGDSYPDQFEAAIATTVTDPAEIAVYVATAERWDGSPLSERWRLLPATVTIAGGVATITGPAWLCARPVFYEGEDGAPLNGLDPIAQANYLPALTIARRFTNTNGTTLDTAQAVLTWERGPYPAFCCPAAGGDPAAIAQVIGRVGVRDASNGLITPVQAVYDSTSGAWSEVWNWATCRPPDRVTVRYLAGVAAKANGEPSEPWSTTICRLAAADLARPVCSCQESNKSIALWQTDVSQIGARDDLFQAPFDFDNPFGARRGQIYAWRQVGEYKKTPGIAI